MGAKASKTKQLNSSLLNNRKQEVHEILSAEPSLIHAVINPEKGFTPMLAASFYNSYECIDELLKFEPDLLLLAGEKDCFLFAAERDNIYVLKELYKVGLKSSYEYKALNILDWSILNTSYRCALYLYSDIGIELKSDDLYIDECKKLGKDYFNIPLFLYCLRQKKPRSETPSFYLSKKQRMDLDNYLPDPHETWASFFKRISKFELYQPPLVHKDSISNEDKKSIYMRAQTKLLEYEYDKKSKSCYINMLSIVKR